MFVYILRENVRNRSSAYDYFQRNCFENSVSGLTSYTFSRVISKENVRKCDIEKFLHDVNRSSMWLENNGVSVFKEIEEDDKSLFVHIVFDWSENND